MKQFFQILSRRVHTIVASRIFIFFIIGLAIFQGLWFAFSFKPILFDELRHVQFITLYSHMISPFIGVQTPDMDIMGQVVREPSYLYYYVMSLFMRLFEMVTQSYEVQIILLRIVNIGLFVLSMLLFRKLLREQKVSSAVANIVLLMFLLMPFVSAMVGAITYDIGVLPLIFWMFILTARIIRQKNIMLRTVVWLIVTACVASVVKYTSLPIAAVCLGAVVIHAIAASRRPKHRFKVEISRQYKAMRTRDKLILGGALVVALALFIERPVVNLVKYKDMAPTCFETLPKDEASERCVKNYVYQRDAEFLSTKSADFKPIDPVGYFLTTWTMGIHSTTIVQHPTAAPLSTMVNFYYLMIFGGAVVILVALRELLKNSFNQFMFALAAVYAASVFYSNYKGYVHLAQPVAITARYLLPIVPVCIYLLIRSFQIIVNRKMQQYLILAIIPYLLISTQGGGIITHLISVDRTYYWEDKTVIDVNTKIKEVLLRITKA